MQKFTGKEYLMIDIANHFGLDKRLWDERIAWVKEHESNLEQFFAQADEPALYYASVRAYREMQKGNPIGHVIRLDGTCSGSQILSCLMRCIKSAKRCNVISTGKRENVYRYILDKMNEVSKAVVKALYEDVKKSIMTSLYGSVMKPIEVFGEELHQVFEEVMYQEMPKVWELNKYFLDIWDANAEEYRWELPDNFNVVIKVKDIETRKISFLGVDYEYEKKVVKPSKYGRGLSANSVHSVDGYFVREMLRRCMYSPAKVEKVKYILTHEGNPCNSKGTKMVQTLWNLYQQTGMLSLRIIDYINEGNKHLVDAEVVLNLLATLPEKPFELITIHDSFGCHPNYGNDVRQQYNNLLAELWESNLLNYILTRITGKKHSILRANKKYAQEVRNAEYALS